MIHAYLKGWLLKANNDIRIIQNEFSLPENMIVTDGVCFHAQQAVEKFLKSFLISKNTEFSNTHNINFLLSKCIFIDKEFEILDLGNLNYYGIDVRYGEEFYLPSNKEAKESFKIASKVKEFVLNKLNVKEEDLKL